MKNKSILVTGGTGSFGKQLIKTILKKYNCKRIVVYSRDELKQFEMSKDLKKHNNLRFFIGDVRDLSRLNMAMKEIDICIHAAAMKQVVASEYNPMEAIKTNVIGTENIVRSSLENNLKKVLALSTDKAASPINLYGATKLVSDKLFISANNIVGKGKTKFSVVRYGNVIASRGSVIPYYLDLINNNKTVLPITNTEMTRFVITLDEGVKFVSDSLNIMKGGEIFIPKIRSMKVLDLVNSFGKNIRYKVIGIRPGEKIHEILFSKDESQNVISFKNFYVIKPSYDFGKKINYFSYKKISGKTASKNFEYSSNNIKNHMSKKEIIELIETIKD